MNSFFQRLFLLVCLAVLAGCATRAPDTKHQAVRTSHDAAITSRTIDLMNPPRDMWDRIRRGFAIPNLYDSHTEEWTQYYAERAKSVYRMSERASRYLYYIVEELERRGLPTELALLPFVESAYNPTAYSRAKASGLWQFIPSTGLHYNLQQDKWRDQRRDPIASTQAALDYLSYLYEFQGDWYLALASYNWGEGSVKRAIQRNEDAGLGTDYLALRMPDETRNYVPKLQAIKNLIADPQRYGITLPVVANEPYFTTVSDMPTLTVSDAARLAEMSLEEFQALNASFNHPVILAEHNPTLLLPKDKAPIFQSNLQRQAHTLNQWKTYQAAKGESYSAIAKKFDVTLEQLRALNGISKRQTRAVAQTLVVPVQAAPSTGLRLAALDTGDSPLPAAGAASKRTPSSTPDIVVRRSPATVRTHTVKRGETLFALAKRYQTTVDALRKLNNLKTNNLKQGARLRVPGTQVRG
ncbi:transglycosylase SLT domain-containing protein [Pusillimonas sp. CC-YST705]|uniref:Transglycosylase SLT domain-containing protein n=1 Tax=Mesopusillimonas faecipullorum TaxID=2755040 RepID=A0ABS8CCB4_9BURK|nr:transglycosylase SLT domain-containing protein [Mesopusillimonas faecipullorum]MCB5363676.1 transglycosylase SLT domain-containing protein [Mesopusillimonas faecipullorum]